MNNKKLIALLLAAMMSVSTASVAFADDTEIIKGYPDGDVWESKLYNAMLEAGDGLGGGSKDGKLTVDEAAAIETLTIDSLSLGALKGLEKCTGLTSLTVTDSQVQDLSFLSGMSNLTELHLSGNNIQDLSALSSLTSLKTLDLSGNNIQDLSSIAGLTKLEVLDVSGNSGLADLATLGSAATSLKELNVSNTSVVDLGALDSAVAGNLTKLSASGNNIEDISSVAAMTKLTYLDLGSNNISVIPDLSDLPIASSADLKLDGNNLNTLNALLGKIPSACAQDADWLNTVSGSSVTGADADLIGSVGKAEELVKTTEVSTDGSDVLTSKKWVKQEDMDALNSAITAALGSGSAAADRNDALTKAIAAFEAAMQAGLKDNSPAPSESREYSDYYGNEKWDELKDEIAKLIEDGKEGETIEFNATGLPYFPASVARALKGEDITLKVRKNGVTYTINGLEIGTVHKIWYDFEDIESELLTADGAEDETSSSTGDKENPSTGR